jgi:hypothetical protein
MAFLLFHPRRERNAWRKVFSDISKKAILTNAGETALPESGLGGYHSD